MFKKILVCLDGSKLAEDILPHVARSGAGRESELILLQVITAHITIPPPESTHVMTFGPGSKPDQVHTADIGKTTTLEPKANLQLREIEREQGEAKVYLEKIAVSLRAQNLKVRTLTLQGDVVDTILEYANGTDISLIALTTHGKSGLKHGVFGSTALTILKKSAIPVLVLKPKWTDV